MSDQNQCNVVFHFYWEGLQPKASRNRKSDLMAESCTALGIIAKKDPKVKNDYCHIVTKYLDPLIDNTWIA